jgi:hypothetical protein
MMRATALRLFAAFLVFPYLFPAPCVAQTPVVSSHSAVAVVVVTVLTKNFKDPASLVQKEDIIVREGRVRKKVIDWIPARGDHASLQLAIVVDDSSRKSVGNQLEDLKKFILAQPATTDIGVYYCLGSSIRPATQISSDHHAAANALRLPLGSFGNLASSYSAVSELIDGWPVTMARREILFLTPGFDVIHHELYSSDMRAAVEQAQRAGILVHPILVSSVGQLGQFSEIARSNLDELASETGGAPLVGALTSPLMTNEETGGAPLRDTISALNFTPILTRLNVILENQYFLVWETTPSTNKDGELRSFTLRAEDNSLKIIAPTKVFVPGAVTAKPH